MRNPRRKNCWLPFLFFVFNLLPELRASEPDLEESDGSQLTYSVLRLWPRDHEQLQSLIEYERTAPENDLNFWKSPRAVNDSGEVMISSQAGEFIQFILRENISYEVAVADVRRELREISERRKYLAETRRDDSSDGGVDFGKYHPYHEIRRFMSELAEEFPTLVEIRTLGYTHEGRPIEAIELTEDVANSKNVSKEIVFIDGGIHSREWVAPHAVLYFMHQLAWGWNGKREIRELLKKYRWVLLPVANPDGYEATWDHRDDPKKAFWRKNRSPEACKSRSKTRCCQGVDLNRNFDAYFGGRDTSTDPCSEIYPGTEAFSEPETKAIRNFVFPRRKKIILYLALHSYSQILAYSSAAFRRYYPRDVSDLRRVAKKAVRKLRSLHGTDYEVGSSADVLYPASGTALDWAKQKARIKYSYLMELRPRKEWWYGLEAFYLKESELVPTVEETWASVLEMIKEIQRIERVPHRA